MLSVIYGLLSLRGCSIFISKDFFSSWEAQQVNLEVRQGKTVEAYIKQFR